jgi:hypothetical protein
MRKVVNVEEGPEVGLSPHINSSPPSHPPSSPFFSFLFVPFAPYSPEVGIDTDKSVECRRYTTFAHLCYSPFLPVPLLCQPSFASLAFLLLSFTYLSLSLPNSMASMHFLRFSAYPYLPSSSFLCLLLSSFTFLYLFLLSSAFYCLSLPSFPFLCRPLPFSLLISFPFLSFLSDVTFLYSSHCASLLPFLFISLPSLLFCLFPPFSSECLSTPL